MAVRATILERIHGAGFGAHEHDRIAGEAHAERLAAFQLARPRERVPVIGVNRHAAQVAHGRAGRGFSRVPLSGMGTARMRDVSRLNRDSGRRVTRGSEKSTRSCRSRRTRCGFAPRGGRGFVDAAQSGSKAARVWPGWPHRLGRAAGTTPSPVTRPLAGHERASRPVPRRCGTAPKCCFSPVIFGMSLYAMYGASGCSSR